MPWPGCTSNAVKDLKAMNGNEYLVAGDLVIDLATGKTVIIVATQVSWDRVGGGTAIWDLEIMNDRCELHYADYDDVQQIDYEDY